MKNFLKSLLNRTPQEPHPLSPEAYAARRTALRDALAAQQSQKRKRLIESRLGTPDQRQARNLKRIETMRTNLVNRVNRMRREADDMRRNPLPFNTPAATPAKPAAPASQQAQDASLPASHAAQPAHPLKTALAAVRLRGRRFGA